VGGDRTELVSAVVRRSLSRSLEVMRHIADRLGIEIDIDPTPEEEATSRVRFERDLQDPLVARSREYAESTYRIVRALGPLLAGRGDEDLAAAVTRIEE